MDDLLLWQLRGVLIFTPIGAVRFSPQAFVIGLGLLLADHIKVVDALSVGLKTLAV